MSAKPSPGCPACAERAPELHEDARGSPIVSIDLGWRLAVRVAKEDGAWVRTARCYVMDADGNEVPGAVPCIADIGKLLTAVEEIK